MSPKLSRLTLAFLFVTACVYYVRVQLPPNTEPTAWGEPLSLYLLRTSADGTAASPYRYRVLTPIVMFAVGSNMTAYAAVELIVVGAFLISIYALARILGLHPILWVAIAVLLNVLAAEGSMTYSTSRYLEAILVAAAVGLLYTRTFWSKNALFFYGVLIALASLNRTTGYLLAVLWVAYQWMTTARRSGPTGRWIIRTTVAYMLIWAIVVGGLVVVLGRAPNWETVQSVADWNRSEWVLVLTLNAPVLIFVASALITKWRGLVTIILILYLPPILLLGRWSEVGLWLPILPIVALAYTPFPPVNTTGHTHSHPQSSPAMKKM